VCARNQIQDSEFPAQPIQEAGYHVAFNGQKAYAGVALISRTPPDTLEAGFADGDDRPRLQRATFGDLVVINTYVPQGREPASEHFQYKLQWFGRSASFWSGITRSAVCRLGGRFQRSHQRPGCV
jgi:exodeoxyribonuclease-3